MQKTTLAIILGIAIGYLSSCSAPSENIPDVAHIPMDIEIKRVESQFANLKTQEDIRAFLDEYPKLERYYFQRPMYPNDSAIVAQIQLFHSFPFNDTLLVDVTSLFTDISNIEKQLENTFRYIQYYYPEFTPPEVYTMVSGFGSFGFGQDILVNDEIIVIGLDYFAGSAATYRPKDIPLYIQRRYEPEYIVPTIAQFLSTTFNRYEPQDNTMLAEMVFHGKTLHFMDKVVPFVQDTLLIGYETQKLGECYQNESVIWAHFVENNLFYETNRFTKNKYIGESPRVQAISYDCPGRIGRWLGWQMVRSLVDQESLSLPQVMEIRNANEILKRSKYRPEP